MAHLPVQQAVRVVLLLIALFGAASVSAQSVDAATAAVEPATPAAPSASADSEPTPLPFDRVVDAWSQAPPTPHARAAALRR